MPTPPSPSHLNAKHKEDSTVTVTTLSHSGSSGSSSFDLPKVDLTSMPTSTTAPSRIHTSPRKARFAEATAVYSPVDAKPNESFAGASVLPGEGGVGVGVRAGRVSGGIPAAFNSYHPQQPVELRVGESYEYGDVRGQTYGYPGNPGNYGYSGGHGYGGGVEMPMTPYTPFTPWRASLRTPGTAGPGGMLSPTWNEERLLEKREASTDKEQAKDLKIKSRVRIAKLLLRSTNFACSLIVLSMLASTFSIFNATKSLPPRNTLPPWAHGTNPWPQITLLVIACVSLALSVAVLWGYRKSNKRAERAAMYYQVFSLGFLAFSVVMWAVGAGVLHGSKANGGGKDIWGWSCNDNTRHDLFQGQVSYDLVCRFQQWSLVCAIIEIIVELLALSVTGIVIYRLWSKRRLRKAMARRDRARSDLYLAHLRLQSAPNTPGGLEPTKRASIASMRAQQAASGHPSYAHQQLPNSGIKEQNVTTDHYADPFMTPAPYTGQPLLAGHTYNQSQGSYHSGPSEAKGPTDTAAVVASPGASTMYAAPRAKPFKLSSPPKKKGKGIASSGPTSPEVEAGSPTFGSPQPIGFGGVDLQDQGQEGMQASSIVPTPTSGMNVQKRLSSPQGYPPPPAPSAEAESQLQHQPPNLPTTTPIMTVFSPPNADSPIKPQTASIFAMPAPSPISVSGPSQGASQGRLPTVSQPLGPPTPLSGTYAGYYEQGAGLGVGWNGMGWKGERRLQHMDAAQGETRYETVQVPEGW